MARNQEDISLVLDKSLSVIDTSRVSIDRNRQTINEVTDDMMSLDCKLENITTALQLDLVELSQFTSLYVRVDLVIEELKRFSLKGLFLLEHFKVQLGFLSLSRLSTEIIDPFQLKIALNNIAMHLPPNLKLPCVPDKSLWTRARENRKNSRSGPKLRILDRFQTPQNANKSVQHFPNQPIFTNQ